MLFVQLDKDVYYPGAKLTAFITVSAKKKIKARRLVARLACHERRLVKKQVINDRYDFDRDKEMSIPYSSHMEERVEQLSTVCFEDEKDACGETELVGENTFKVEFFIPKTAEPTSHEFGHDNRIFIWKLHVKLDVPFGIDKNAVKEVVVQGQYGVI